MRLGAQLGFRDERFESCSTLRTNDLNARWFAHTGRPSEDIPRRDEDRKCNLGLARGTTGRVVPSTINIPKAIAPTSRNGERERENSKQRESIGGEGNIFSLTAARIRQSLGLRECRSHWLKGTPAVHQMAAHSANKRPTVQSSYSTNFIIIHLYKRIIELSEILQIKILFIVF